MKKNFDTKQKKMQTAEDDTKLFKIGEVADALGLTRRILINYEDLGLVTPTVRNEGKVFATTRQTMLFTSPGSRFAESRAFCFPETAATLKITNIWTIKSIT